MASGDQKDCSRSHHELRGSGSGSRIRLNTGLLEEAGWKILSHESGNQVHLTYVDPEGKKFKSSKDIERKLEADGILNQFLRENRSELASKVSSTSKDCVEDSDEDYKPPLKKQLLKVMSNLGEYFLWSLVVMFRFPLHKIQKFEVLF